MRASRAREVLPMCPVQSVTYVPGPTVRVGSNQNCSVNGYDAASAGACVGHETRLAISPSPDKGLQPLVFSGSSQLAASTGIRWEQHESIH